MNIAKATNEIMEAWRRPVKPLYLRFENTREIEPGLYESRWLEKQLSINCERTYNQDFKEWEPAVSIQSIDNSGTLICMTARTKMTVDEMKDKLRCYPFKIDVSNNFFYN